MHHNNVQHDRSVQVGVGVDAHAKVVLGQVLVGEAARVLI
jgi:hypothetical protein